MTLYLHVIKRTLHTASTLRNHHTCAPGFVLEREPGILQLDTEIFTNQTVEKEVFFNAVVVAVMAVEGRARNPEQPHSAARNVRLVTPGSLGLVALHHPGGERNFSSCEKTCINAYINGRRDTPRGAPTMTLS